MGASREGASLWWSIKHRKINDFIHRHRWKSEYFLQDTIFTPFNRFIGCPLFGHRKRGWIKGDWGERIQFCWNCYRQLAEPPAKEKE